MDDTHIVELRSIIRNNPSLIWYTHAYDTLNETAIAEAIYNYGTWTQLQAYHKAIGLEHAHTLFRKLAQTPRSNLRPKTLNYFSLYYTAYAS